MFVVFPRRLILSFACAILLGAPPESRAAASERAPADAPDAVSPLLIGATVPEVPVRTLDGETVDLRSAVSGQPTVLVFYRGGW